MSNFQGEYLRVFTPRTTDGINLKYKNNQVQFKESHLPLTARKMLDRQNAKRPEHLKHRIEIAGGVTRIPQVQQPVQTNIQQATPPTQTQGQQASEPVEKPKNKGGRPSKKNQEQVQNDN